MGSDAAIQEIRTLLSALSLARSISPVAQLGAHDKILLSRGNLSARGVSFAARGSLRTFVFPHSSHQNCISAPSVGSVVPQILFHAGCPLRVCLVVEPSLFLCFFLSCVGMSVRVGRSWRTLAAGSSGPGVWCWSLFALLLFCSG